jgi:hypothetical protein
LHSPLITRLATAPGQTACHLKSIAISNVGNAS